MDHCLCLDELYDFVVPDDDIYACHIQGAGLEGEGAAALDELALAGPESAPFADDKHLSRQCNAEKTSNYKTHMSQRDRLRQLLPTKYSLDRLLLHPHSSSLYAHW